MKKFSDRIKKMVDAMNGKSPEDKEETEGKEKEEMEEEEMDGEQEKNSGKKGLFGRGGTGHKGLTIMISIGRGKKKG
jgi:hypothetical protein